MNKLASSALRGFTIVEVIITIVVIGILATLSYVAYDGVQERAANNAVQDSLRVGGELLEINYTRKRDYPPNMAGTEFIANGGVTTVLYTDAPTIRVHGELTPAQNLQLMLNVCNAHTPYVKSGLTYYTSCSVAGNNYHVSGQRSSNIVLKGRYIERDEFQLKCVPAITPECNQITSSIIEQFETQGGTWPIDVRAGNAAIPEPEEVVSGQATRYCLEARYDRFPDITVGHIKDTDKGIPQNGPCPDDPDLRYLPPAEPED